MNNKLLTAFAALTLTACGTPIVPAGEAIQSSVSTEAELKGPQRAKRVAVRWAAQVSDTSTNPTFATSFVIANTYDLFVAFDIPVALAGQHNAVFEITSPDGTVYQRTEVPFNSGGASQYRVWSSMPVAGTWIEQFAMTGTWSVQVFLDDETVARASKSFLLQ